MMVANKVFIVPRSTLHPEHLNIVKKIQLSDPAGQVQQLK